MGLFVLHACGETSHALAIPLVEGELPTVTAVKSGRFRVRL